ncbi:MAG: C25 family cysteine peptidase, partial [Candidatus Baldrarchaeia archaeon]
MRKRKICSLLLVILFIASFPATFYMDVSSIRGANHTDTNRINIEAPRENIHVGSSSKAAFSRTITIKFPEPMIVKNKKLGEYVWFKMHGCRYIATPGHPALPIKVITVKLDRDSTVFGVHVKVTERKLKGTYNVIPAFKPHPLNSEVKKYISKPDPKIYGSKSWYPDKWYSYRIYRGLDPETMSRVKYLVVYFYPLRYKPAEGYMIRAEKAEITITYSEAAEEKHPASAIDLAIITSPLLEEEAVLLAKWKNETGISSIVVNTEWIYQNYPGVDEPEKIRNYIKDAVDNLGIKFVLIFGDADQVPVRYAWIPDGYDDTGDFDGSVVETDLYYADLDYSWDDNGDGRWGDLGNDTVDGIPDVYVGRLPASTVDEASILINKIKNYDPLNEWFMRYLLLGTDMFGGREGEILKDYIQSNLLWSNFSYTKLYETAGTLTVENAMTKIDEGYGFINFAGHGNYYFWSFGEGGVYYDANASSQVNGNLSVIFTTSCLTARFSDRDCIGEAFLLNPEGGGIAYCGASRVTWGYAGEHIIDGLSGEIDWRFTEAFFNCLNQSSSMEPYAGVVWAIALTKYAMNHPLNTEYGGYFLDWKTIAEYGTLLGDPTLCIKGRGAPPPPPPPSKLYGYVHDLNGNPVGNAIVQVYNYSSGVLYGQNTTDSSGYYEIYLSNSGYMYMQVNASGYYPYRSTHFYYSTGVDTQKNITLTAFFSPAVDILLVVDDDAKYYLDEGVWPDEIRSPLETAGYVVHVWNESIQGLPCLDALLDVDAVFWHTGTMWEYAVDPVDAATLIQYVQSGGNLVLEGEDIGWDHEADEFMINVAHAIYEVDDAAVESFEITYPLHPVVTNLPSTFSFTTKPSYPDGVEPTNGGLEVIRYKDTDYTAVTVYDGRSKSEGRVVYVAFPIHYIGQSERQTLLLNSIGWATSQYLVKVSTNKRVYISNEDIKVV